MVQVDWGPWPVMWCQRCRTVWPLANFHHAPAARKCTCTCAPYECLELEHYDSVCICCRNTARHRRPFYFRAYLKVRASVRRHIKQDGFRSVGGWETATGLTVSGMTEELIRVMESNRCPHCGRQPDGLHDMTLDRRNRKLPITRDNYRWICLTCNKEKARTPEHIWQIRSRCWDIYVTQVEPGLPVQQLLPI
jgi:hypothetical protein